VEQAEAIVTAIYAKAGVTASWTDDAQLTVVIVPREKAAGLNQSVEAMGFAPGTEKVRGKIAYVLAHRVNQAAEKCGAEKGVVLGAAIAHEIGHLLLPFNAHSKTGVMRAEVTQADFRHAAHGQLLFTDEQAAQIRSRMAFDQQDAAAARGHNR
jgi:hypothetical protein